MYDVSSPYSDRIRKLVGSDEGMFCAFQLIPKAIAPGLSHQTWFFNTKFKHGIMQEHIIKFT